MAGRGVRREPTVARKSSSNWFTTFQSSSSRARAKVRRSSESIVPYDRDGWSWRSVRSYRVALRVAFEDRRDTVFLISPSEPGLTIRDSHDERPRRRDRRVCRQTGPRPSSFRNRFDRCAIQNQFLRTDGQGRICCFGQVGGCRVVSGVSVRWTIGVSIIVPDVPSLFTVGLASS